MSVEHKWVRRYLAEKHCALWPGVQFDLTDEVELKRAVGWLSETLKGLGGPPMTEWHGEVSDEDLVEEEATCPECGVREVTGDYGTCFRCRIAGISFNRRGLRDCQL